MNISGYICTLTVHVLEFSPVMFVHLLQRVAGLLLEAVDGFLAVPDCAGQRVFPPKSVLVHGAWGHKYN